MVYGFVKQSGGFISVYSEPGHGTTIKLYLPRTLETNETPYHKAVGTDLTGSEVVLVVEDDDTVRSTVVSLLNDLGYRVLEASSGAAALTMLESGEPVDLLFTDVIMPGSVSSRALAARAIEIRPSLKVLFTSGYTENAISQHGVLDPGVEFLQKPFTPRMLAQRLRQILDQPSA